MKIKYIRTIVTLISLGVLLTACNNKNGRDNNNVYWGTINDGEIGYINISQMLGFSDINNENVDISEEISALNVILDHVMTDLNATRAIIIDIRFNGGGSDMLSMMIANRFATQRQRLLSKYTHGNSTDNGNNNTANTPQVHAYTSPSANPYTNPVAIISSRFTFSAAEIFLMIMSALPNVTLVGDPSGGGLSDVLNKQLPNGWEFTLSNEIYLDYLGKNHEVSGVPMDINIPMFSLLDLEMEKDSAIETAIDSFGLTPRTL